MKKKIGLLLVTVLSGYTSISQILDTSDTHTYKVLEVSTISEYDILFLLNDSSKIDTSLNLFYNYYPAYKKSFPFIDQGLEATAMLTLAATNEKNVNLDLGIESLKPYFFDKSINIYKTPRPFTRINYSQGAQEMINIGVTHAQQISNRLYFGVDYRRIKNQNFYYSNIQNFERVRMASLFNNKFYTSYFSKDRRYELIASYVWNKSQNVESGGLVSDSLFNSLGGRDKINNNSARYKEAYGTQAQNYFKISQFYRLGGMSTDTSLDQSLSQFKSQFFLTTEFDNNRIEFEDNQPDSANYGYWPNAFKDSIYHRSLSNQAGILFTLKPITLAASISHSYNRIYMNGVQDRFNNVYLNGDGKLNLKGFKINVNARFGFLGYNLGDYSVGGNASAKLKSFDLYAGLLSQLVEPNYTEKTFYSEVINWSNTFSKVSINQLFGGLETTLKNHFFSGDILAETSNGLIYFTGKSDIKQNNDFVTLLRTNLQYSFESKHIGTDLKLTLQNSSNQQVLPRPNSAVSGNIYAQFNLFKKKLVVQTGVRGYWFSSFNAPVYNPYTRQWHNSGNNFTQTPPINLYTNAKVRSFYFGIEFFHSQQGFQGNTYYSSPGYPQMPRSMRLNIQWDLNN
ncbi:MAG: hypothetical protein COA58_09015 [Bacteroidetes bacterium]|nr:MAG: hypothetical protein COA58_09015 [Bacteroidota bacterium]